ncbi:MAG: protein kinase [Myxococcales bacterium]|nr:protein kinase [Myxococcales bacterium]MDP3502146.1 protein kinase [Myxococcales bacterium]
MSKPDPSAEDTQAGLETMVRPESHVSPTANAPRPPSVAPVGSANVIVSNPTPAPTGPTSQPTPGTGGSKNSYTSPDLQAVTDPEPGTRLHHYEIIKLIGRGGMGSVFLARDLRLGRRVAIKFLRTHSADMTKRFILEARTTAAVAHENIVVIFEVDAWQGSPFMVFEFLQGKPLTKVVPDSKPVAVGRAVELMIPVVRALASAHSQGIVHRDLKPDNIFVTDTGITKVLDFGIAKVLQGDETAPEYVARPRAPRTNLEDEDDSELTQKGAMMGTMSYMAPEQWGIGVSIDHRADIWAVGIMLFKMLSGKHPLDPLKGHQLMVTGMLDKPMPTLHSKAPDVPVPLAQIVDKCLMKRKEDRWPDAVTLLRALEPFLPGRYTQEIKIDESPYAGLSSFQESDAARFFGRRLEISAVVNRIRERPLIGIVGPSGAGKSSFVRAGLVPALKRSGESWEALVMRPGRSPLAGLASLISPLIGTATSVADDIAEQKKLAQRISTEPGYVGSVLRSLARRDKKNVLVFVDQFEELYTLVPDGAERKAFTAALAGVADDPTSPIRLALSIRSDFLDRVAEDSRFMAELSQGLVFLASPGPEGLREAIVQPAELAGYKFESPTIVDDMIGHLQHTSGALPLLQFAASMLWENRDPAKKQLTKFAYEAIGGVGGALASHADSVLQKMSPAKVATTRNIFLRLVTPERTRAIVSMDELREGQADAGELEAVIDELVQARLLVVQTGAGVATVEIVHESLITSWPTLRRWLDESGEDAAFLEQLRLAARAWNQKERPADLLWRGELAEEAQRFQRRYNGPLGDSQHAFLDAVVNQIGAATRRRRTLLVGAVAFLSLLVAASAVALVVIQGARSEAQRQAEAALTAEEAAKQSEKKAVENAKRAADNEADARRFAAEVEERGKKLEAALKAAEDARVAAESSERSAQKNAVEAEKARLASERARRAVDEARRELQGAYSKEQERARRLEEQLGGGVIDVLK